jgi:hypothetical protein
MTAKADFTDEEWARIKRAPFVAGLAISLADPGGPIEAVKETSATLRTVTGGAGAGYGELVDAVAREVASERKNQLSGFKPRGATAGADILDELGGVYGIVSAKATPEETDGYRRWLLATAQEAANAAKEGGFMGFKAERVSEGEQKMLDRLSKALS